jgi:hypothetical protein
MIINEPIKVKIMKITSFSQEKCMNGSMYIQGICQADTEDESFEFDFSYKGKSDEDKEKIMDYLKGQARSILIKNRSKKDNKNTLGDFIQEFI